MCRRFLVYGLLVLWLAGCSNSNVNWRAMGVSGPGPNFNFLVPGKRAPFADVEKAFPKPVYSAQDRYDPADMPGQTGLTASYVDPGKIVVTTGSLGRAYEVLGEVSYNTLETINIVPIFTDTVFRSPLSVAAAGKTAQLSRESMQDRLRQVARQKYGNEVDAVLNMTYDVDPEGETFGSGLAVRFVDPGPPPVRPSPAPATQSRTVQQRLEELKTICEQELITEADCDAKRKSLLDSL